MIVHLLLITVVVLAIPAVRRAERRAPYVFALGVLMFCLMWRLMPLGAERNLRFQTHSVAFFFALGWLIHQSRAVRQRVLTTALCIITIPGALGLGGYFADAQREWFVALSLIAVTWVRAVPVPAVVLRVVAVIAAASLWILITHFRIWPPLARAFDREWAYVLTILAGVLVWATADQLSRLRDARADDPSVRTGGPSEHQDGWAPRHRSAGARVEPQMLADPADLEQPVQRTADVLDPEASLLDHQPAMKRDQDVQRR